MCVCVFVCGQMQQEPSILTWVDEMGSEKEAKKRREKRNKRQEIRKKTEGSTERRKKGRKWDNLKAEGRSKRGEIEKIKNKERKNEEEEKLSDRT